MPLRRCGETVEASDIDSDGDIIPAAEFSSTDDETSTNARVRRHDEKRRVCRRVRVGRAISRIEESDTPMPEARGRHCRDRPVLAVTTGKAIASRKVGGARIRMTRGITVDSGAADNVFPRRMIRRGMKVRQSEASRQGVHYVAADGVRIANEGEMDFKFQTKNGSEHSWTFQVAAVNKVLASVSALVDSGHKVVFEKDRKTGVDISFITNMNTGKSIRMNRDRNVWTIDTFVNEEPGFSRPE